MFSNIILRGASALLLGVVNAVSVPALAADQDQVILQSQNDAALDALFMKLRSGQGDPDEWQQYIEAIWATSPSAGVNVLVDRAQMALAAQDAATAGILINHINGLAPHFVHGWILKGELALLEEDPVVAEISYARAVALEPRHYEAISQLGYLAAQSDDKKLAYKRFREALDWNPY
ncbi:MAG: hypothetical protein AAF723_10550, partial [Pseudomonadota bacterium]